MISDFRSGLTFWWRGWGHLFSHKKLLAVALLPMLLSTSFAIGFVYLLLSYFPVWVQALVASVLGSTTGVLYSLVYYPLVIGGSIVTFMAAVYLAFISVNVIAVPFYSHLAERTLVQLGKPTDTSWRTVLRLFRSGLIKLFFLLALGLILFILSFVPVLNILAMVCALFIMAFDCLDYSFDATGLGLRQRLGYLWRERSQWAGMAAGLALTLLVPGLTLLVLPGAVVGGALILKERK